MVEKLRDPQQLGGVVPWVSLARSDADFNPRGGYWRGFRDIDAVSRTVHWHRRRNDRHGIRNLRFGDVVTDIIADADRIEITSNRAYTLIVDGRHVAVRPRRQTIRAVENDGARVSASVGKMLS